MTALQRALVALAVLALAVGALVALVMTGNDTSQLVAIVGPVVSGAWAVSEVRAARNDHGAVLGTIADNVNGKLDARIRAAVRAVVNEPIAGPLGEPGPPYDLRGG